MADFFATLGGRVTIGMLNETLGNLDEEERAMLAGWGLAIHRKEGWRDCSCVAATNSSMSARWLEEASPGSAASLAGEPVSEAVPGWCEVRFNFSTSFVAPTKSTLLSCLDDSL